MEYTDMEQRILDMWPKFEDGSYVRLGDSYIDTDGDENEVMAIEFNNCCADLIGVEGYRTGFEPFERVKRPAPKVLDADGAEIKVGDTVYDTELVNGDKFTVESIDKNGDVRARGGKCILTQSSVAFTHMQPAIDADGVLIKVGDTVWHEDGSEWLVEELNRYGVRCFDGDKRLTFDPKFLRHNRPDSWERLEEDIAKYPCRYAEEVKGSKFDSCSECPWWHSEVMARDIARRAKALAEKEAAR